MRCPLPRHAIRPRSLLPRNFTRTTASSRTNPAPKSRFPLSSGTPAAHRHAPALLKPAQWRGLNAVVGVPVIARPARIAASEGMIWASRVLRESLKVLDDKALMGLQGLSGSFNKALFDIWDSRDSTPHFLAASQSLFDILDVAKPHFVHLAKPPCVPRGYVLDKEIGWDFKALEDFQELLYWKMKADVELPSEIADVVEHLERFAGQAEITLRWKTEYQWFRDEWRHENAMALAPVPKYGDVEMVDAPEDDLPCDGVLSDDVEMLDAPPLPTPPPAPPAALTTVHTPVFLPPTINLPTVLSAINLPAAAPASIASDVNLSADDNEMLDGPPPPTPSSASPSASSKQSPVSNSAAAPTQTSSPAASTSDTSQDVPEVVNAVSSSPHVADEVLSSPSKLIDTPKDVEKPAVDPPAAVSSPATTPSVAPTSTSSVHAPAPAPAPAPVPATTTTPAYPDEDPDGIDNIDLADEDDMKSGTEAYAVTAIRSKAYFEAMFKEPRYVQVITESIAAVHKAIADNQPITTEDARPMRLACAYVCHAARQPWGKWKQLTDCSAMPNCMNMIRKFGWVVARTHDLTDFGAEGRALKKDIQDAVDRLENKEEGPSTPRRQAKLRTRRV